jgi:probable HAF family extracellular repeat protein
VGVSESASGPRAFLWQPLTSNSTVGGLTNLGDFPGGNDRSEGFDINTFGEVVGRSWTADGARAFLWRPTVANSSDGTLTGFGDLPTGFADSIALAVNDVGQVVGNLEDEYHGFVWDSLNGLRDINDYLDPVTGTDWIVRRATGINNRGQIIAEGVRGGVFHGLLLTPVPEPTTLLLTAVAAPWFARRRYYRSATSRAADEPHLHGDF